VVARAAREMGILTVAVVTKPFSFEGTRRMRQAEAGIAELQNVADTVIVIPNQNLFRIATERTTLQDAFKMADDVLYKGVRGVTDLMLVPGIINLDFNDVKTVMSEMGQAMMGTGEAEGDRRAILAAEMAISSPLLDGISMQGAKGVLINITGGDDLTLYEVDEAANRIREEVDADANIIFGTAYDQATTGRIRVSVVATGLGDSARAKRTNTIDLTVLKSASSKPEMAPSMETVKAANVTDFTQVAATKQREREEAEDEYPDLEIPAFLRRQAN
jgi:cell division protein FtsZ